MIVSLHLVVLPEGENLIKYVCISRGRSQENVTGRTKKLDFIWRACYIFTMWIGVSHKVRTAKGIT